MRTAVKETEVYTIRELKESHPDGFQRAYEDHVEYAGVDNYWAEYILEMAKEAGAMMGINVKHIWWEGFGSQGDGACIEGDYKYAKGSAAAVKKDFPRDQELQRIASGLAATQKRWFYGITASIDHRWNHYYHSHSVGIEVDTENSSNIGYHSYDTERERNMADDIRELLRDFMDWIYKKLRDEFDYLCSEEYFIENSEANQWEYTDRGKLY